MDNIEYFDLPAPPALPPKGSCHKVFLISEMLQLHSRSLFRLRPFRTTFTNINFFLFQISFSKGLNTSVEEPKLFIFGLGSRSSYSHILSHKTVL